MRNKTAGNSFTYQCRFFFAPACRLQVEVRKIRTMTDNKLRESNHPLEMEVSRRRFFGLGATTAVMRVARPDTVAAGPKAGASAGYCETDHIRCYYQRARF